jgi:hypothetical protein
MPIITSGSYRGEEANRASAIAIIARTRRGCSKGSRACQARKASERVHVGTSKDFSIISRCLAERAEYSSAILVAVPAFSRRAHYVLGESTTTTAITYGQIIFDRFECDDLGEE